MPVSGNSDAGIVCLAQHAPHTVGRWPLEQPQAFHNQRPQAIAATGFPQPAATGHCSHRLSTTRTCTQTSGRSHGPRCNAAFQQSNKESSNISRSSSSSTSSPSTAIFAQDGHRPSNHCHKTPTRPQALHTCGGLRHVSGGASAVIGKPQLTKPCVVISFLRLRRARPLFGS